jgi:two-component system phosphate regulon sensor histidine kinase PhoR
MISRKSMIWQIFPQYLILILISLSIVALYSSDALKNLFIQRTRLDLESSGRLIGRLLTQQIKQVEIETINQEIHGLATAHHIRITIILPDGRVIADSEENYQIMENHADRPEIIEAYHGRMGSSIRFSYTLNLDMLYVAVPVFHENQVIAVVRTSMPSSDLSQALQAIYRKIIFLGLLVILAAGFIGFLYVTHLNKPIQTLKTGAQKIGNGELDHRIYISRPEELKLLSEAMNHMAAQLKSRINVITEQRNELEAVLSSMVEAVMVIDNEEKIIRINQAMAKLININHEAVMGKKLHEIIRNINLQRFIRNTLNSNDVQDAEFNIAGITECIVQAHGTLLWDAAGKSIGGLIVLNDVTRQKALEKVRREFVANVSHELKTPITAIQGFVETLQEGAIHDNTKGPEFLSIIMKHTDRLNKIIEDLLDLSRIEQESEKDEIMLQPVAIQDILEEVITLCLNQATEKQIQLKHEFEPGLMANINKPLLIQAIVNILDNAIKYSPSQSMILIQTCRKDRHICILVKDTGPGIPEKDLSRIFERFYRVDKTRSRHLGGTGLGLSIVKHIALAHHGSVSVESKLDEGSTFIMMLPES